MPTSSLPIEHILPQVHEELERHASIVVQAPPGAGKSTLLPLSLLKANWLEGQKIIMLEPRRLAARGVAERMAFLLGEKVGETVGYSIRFERKVSARTQLEVVTEGILTRRLQQDNTLEGIGAIIFDEFHERSLQADLGLALCREVQQVLRPELKIIVMSATFDAAALASILEAPVVTSEGRQYPIDMQYWPPVPQEPIHVQMAKTIRKALLTFEEGDILAFLPGAGEINRTATLLEDNINSIVYPLYGQLPFEEQQKALLPDAEGKRKVVLATSIAETSLTIEGVKIVVDSGLTRKPQFNRYTGFTRLETIEVTKDIADQRAGRAGRLGPGYGIRMWSKLTQEHLSPRFEPEIADADLSSLLLSLKEWGTNDMEELSWLTPPPLQGIRQAEELLLSLGATDEEGRITTRGKILSQFPAHPRIAHLLLEAKAEGQGVLAAKLAAILEEKDPLDTKKVGVDLGLRVLELDRGSTKDRRWSRILKSEASWRQLLKVPSQQHSYNPDYRLLGKLLSYAYPERVAKQLERHGNRYQLASGTIVRLPDTDRLTQEEWIVVGHFDAGGNRIQKSADGRAFLAAAVDVAQLSSLIKSKNSVAWNMETGMLEAKKSRVIGVLEVSQQPLPTVSMELRLEALAEAVRTNPHWLNWSKEVEHWQARISSLRLWRQEDQWPAVSQEALLQRLDEWLLPYASKITNAQQLKKLNMLEMLPAILSYKQQQALPKLAPERLQVPSGSHIRLQYNTEGNAPILAARIQELFGLAETPSINNGQQAVLIHLLSPGYKPVQVTQDLRSFWDNTYEEVKKELKRRYPKHSWPENPWEATAIRGVPKKKRK